jgi:glycosyltransferase involved in cell wall biosynthesis
MQHLKLIINCGPCERYISQCVDSVRSQTYSEWKAYVTVDACRDGTYDAALRAAGRDRRIHVVSNKRRMYSLCNLIRAIRRSRAAPDDVIVILDGDDWFAHRGALRIIADTYAEHNCWMTYGSWISNWVEKSGERTGMWPAYPDGTTNFRHVRWLGTAVRTWKKWLWDRVDDRDLRDATVGYYRVSEDQATMLPLLEMSTTRKARHIPEALMIYNQTNPWNSGLHMTAEMDRNALHLDKQKPYLPLLPRAEAARASACEMTRSRDHSTV